MNVEIQLTEHPYVVRNPGIGRGEPIITKGHGLPCDGLLAITNEGRVEEVDRDYPFLSAAAIHDAISYYLDHQAEIESDCGESH